MASATPPEDHRTFASRIIALCVTVLAVALLVKSFVLEVHYVPTESMEPTIIGRQTLGDRVLVGRSFLGGASTERFDLVVFQYPLSRQVRFVKRLVGMPGEHLEIHGGDVWTRPLTDEAAPLAIARKPHALQRRLFDARPCTEAVAGAESLMRSWTHGTGADVAVAGDTVRLAAGADGPPIRVALRVRPTAVRQDPWAASRRERRDEALVRVPVSDLRLQAEIHGESGPTFLELTDGHPGAGPIRLQLADGRLTLDAGGRDGQREAVLVRDGLARDVWHPLALENVDDQIRVTLDDEVLVEIPYRGVATPARAGSAAFGVLTGTARVRGPLVGSDLHWISAIDSPGGGGPAVFEVPDEHVLLLGDNSANSEDGRGWRAVAIRTRHDGRVHLGDVRGLSDESFETMATSLLPPTNPRVAGPPLAPGMPLAEEDADRVHLFRDLMGREMRLAPGSWDLLDASRLAPAGSPELLAWHGRIIESEDDPRIAVPAVSTRLLVGLSHGGSTIAGFATPMHFAHLDDLIGRPWLALRRQPDGGAWLPSFRVLR